MAATTTPTQRSRRFIKRAKVIDHTCLSTSEIYRRIAAGTFPRQVMLGPKSVVWIEAEVLAWCEARISESRGEVAEMMGRKKADQDAPDNTPFDDACSHSKRLIARPETDHPCNTFRDGIGLLPCGTQPEKE